MLEKNSVVRSRIVSSSGNMMPGYALCGEGLSSRCCMHQLDQRLGVLQASSKISTSRPGETSSIDTFASD